MLPPCLQRIHTISSSILTLNACRRLYGLAPYARDREDHSTAIVDALTRTWPAGVCVEAAVADPSPWRGSALISTVTRAYTEAAARPDEAGRGKAHLSPSMSHHAPALRPELDLSMNLRRSRWRPTWKPAHPGIAALTPGRVLRPSQLSDPGGSGANATSQPNGCVRESPRHVAIGS